MSLLDRLLKAGTSTATTLADASFFTDKDEIPTEIPALNIALSGTVDGGLTPGILMVTGMSKTFKTSMSLYMVAAYLKQFPDAVCIFYDSEFGSTPEYFNTFGIDLNRVVHIPIEHIEQLKFDMVKKLDEIKKGDKVIFFVDSVGNLASKKEVDDATDEKSVADMTRAKSLKSFWRIVTPKITQRNIPMIAINHIYMEMGLYPKAIVSGGNGGILSSNAIWIITKSQEKEGTETVGFNFNITIEKSRTVIEKSRIPLTVRFDNGIDKYSGLIDLAIESGDVVKPKNGWYALVDPVTGELGGNKRLSDTNTDEFLGQVIKRQSFKEFIKKKYRLTYSQNIKEALVNEENLESDNDEE